MISPFCLINPQLLSGTAEIFGCEMAPSKEYSFTFCKMAVSTWHGCELEVSGTFSRRPYVSKCDQQAVALNIHTDIKRAVENSTARVETAQVPRIAFIGPQDTGKSVMAKRVCNNVIKGGGRPIFVQLDVGQGDGGMPACLHACSLKAPISQLSTMELSLPLTYFYGEVTPQKNVSLYKKQMKFLAADIEKKIQDCEESVSVVVIDTCNWTDGEGFGLLVDVAKTFRIDFLFVLGDERLSVELGNEVVKTTCTVYKMPRADGISSKERDFQMKRRNMRIREYFYGINGNLCPHSLIVSYSTIKIYELKKDSHVPLYALPIGQSTTLREDELSLVSLSNELKHRICSVSTAKSESELLETPVYGFVYMYVISQEVG